MEASDHVALFAQLVHVAKYRPACDAAATGALPNGIRAANRGMIMPIICSAERHKRN